MSGGRCIRGQSVLSCISMHSKGNGVFRCNMNDGLVLGWSPAATRAQKFKGVSTTLSSTAIKQTNAAKSLL